MTATRWCGALALLLLFSPHATAGDDLASRIEEVIHAPAYKSARWGVLVVEAEGDKIVYAHNADLLSPASVTKLYTCAAALAVLGKDHVFETPIHARGELSKGVLHGDLILVGSGDFTMGGRAGPDGKLEFKDHDHIYAGYADTKTQLTDADPLAGLKELARQVKKAGVDRVEGDVLIDDRLFERARGSGSGPDILSPIMINDNIVDVRVTPGAKAGEPAKVELIPTTDYLQIDVRVRTGPANSGTRITTEHVGPQRYVVRGAIAANSGPVVRICPVDDPSGFARALLIEALRREGVAIRASALKPPTAELPPHDGYEKLQRVAVLKSPPLSEALKVTLKVSHNLYASTLPLVLAAHDGKRTYAEGMNRQGKALKELGVDVGAISFQSGAGGGNGDRVTPRVTVQLLQSMAKRPDAELFRAMLPVLGEDGSLADVIGKDSPARGKVVGKTGTYTDGDLMNDRVLLRAKSLAGYMTTASGKKLIYAIFVNDVLLPSGVDGTREGKVIAKLCELIYQHGP